MAKNSALKRQEEDDFDFSDMIGSPGDDAINGMFSNLVGASNHQMNIAIELTKLVIEKGSVPDIKEEAVFSIFKRASKAVSESFPLKPLWDQLG